MLDESRRIQTVRLAWMCTDLAEGGVELSVSRVHKIQKIDRRLLTRVARPC